MITGVMIFDGLLQLAGQRQGLLDQNKSTVAVFLMLFIIFFLADVIEFFKKLERNN